MNQKQLHDALIRAKMIYGLSPVHVNLIALQTVPLVPVSELVDYILQNPSLVNTEFSMKDAGFLDYAGLFVKSVVAIPYLESQSVIREGDSGATVVVTLSGDTFVAGSETTSNWTVDAGATGLTLSAATKDSSTQVTLSFTGTAKTGTLTIKAKDEALTGSIASDTVSLLVEAKSLDYTTLNTFVPTVGTPIMCANADGTFVISTGAPADGESITIGDVVYTFKNSLNGTPDDGIVWVLNDGVNNTATNLYNAIRGDATVGVINVKYKFGSGAVAHPLVTPTNSPAGSVVITAKIAGISGNSIVVSTDCETNGAWTGDIEHLEGGVDGTPSKAGKMWIGDKLYIAKVECFVYDSAGYESISFDV